MTQSDPTSRPPTIREVYQRTLKPTDIFFNVYICRPLAAVIVRLIAATRVVPHQVTLLSLLVAGMSCAVLLLLPWPWGLWVGVGLFELSYVLDKADGMLARWRGTASTVGQLLDFLMDEIKAFLLLGCFSVASFRASGDTDFLLWGIAGLAGLASGIGITTFVRRPEIVRPPAEPVDEAASAPAPARPMVRLAEGCGRFFIHYPSYLWLAAVLSEPRVFLYPYVVVNGLYFARSLLGVALRFGRASAA